MTSGEPADLKRRVVFPALRKFLGAAIFSNEVGASMTILSCGVE